VIIFGLNATYIAFTHAGLTNRDRIKSLLKVFLCFQGHVKPA